MLQTTTPSPEDGLAGLIERVTFHNEETGFSVLRVKVKGHRDLATVVGSLASVSIDHGYEGRGQSATYTQLRRMAEQRGATYRVVHAGDQLDWDPALAIEVLSPPAEFISTDADPAKVSEHGLLNSNSIVLRVRHGKNVFIFPGDCYGGAFEQYLQKTVAPEKLAATVLTAPHHGFNPGIQFPKMTHPQIVVASCLADYPANANTPNPRSPR